MFNRKKIIDPKGNMMKSKSKSKFETGDYVLCSHNCKFYKIDLITRSGSLERLHLSHKSGNIVANGFINDNSYVIRGDGHNPVESNIFTIDGIIQFFGWIALILVVLYYMQKIFG